jgi:hypothetical protein
LQRPTIFDLSRDVHAYDSNEIQVDALGDVIEDTMEKCEELDSDEGKKVRGQYELLKQVMYLLRRSGIRSSSKTNVFKAARPSTAKSKGSPGPTSGSASLLAPSVASSGDALCISVISQSINFRDQPFILSVEHNHWNETKCGIV